ncbi:MAG: hypothetical protein IRZ00_15270, partial [Gemmatimonadetes bacterium]|nr:hypothetical protein [Gemmatimonadota bacterium]
MLHRVARSGKVWRRLGVLVAAGLAAVASARFFLPGRWNGRPDLQLVALTAGGQFRSSVTLPRQWVDTAFEGVYGARARIPLILAVRNVGDRAARPERLDLSIPARFRLVDDHGRELPHQIVAGNPLVRYRLDGPLPLVQPGRLPTVLSNPDTLWLEPILPSLYCVSVGDSVPDFIPATPADPATLANVRVFYSFAGRALPGRQAGLLDLHLDTTLLRHTVAAPPVLYDATTLEPQQPLPPMGPLRYVGTNTARCGEPEEPMEVTSYLWETPDGGRFLDLYMGGKSRKYLFDLDHDGMVELEMWDPDGDGRFEVKRPVRYAIPPFLLPPAPPPAFDPAVFAALPPDSLARLNVFHGGVYRQSVRPDTTATVDLARFHPSRATSRQPASASTAPAPPSTPAPQPSPAPAAARPPAGAPPQARPR